MSEVDLQERDGYQEWVTTTPAMFANPIRAFLKKTPIDKWKGDFLTMRLLTFVRFIRMITKDGPADLDKIQDMGLLAVKLTQIFALRPDLLSEEKCRQLQSLYQRANSIPKEDSMKLIEDRAPSGFLDAFESFEEEPFAAASIGQVHRGVLKDGSEVVVKIIKADFEKSFRKDVARMRAGSALACFSTHVCERLVILLDCFNTSRITPCVNSTFVTKFKVLNSFKPKRRRLKFNSQCLF